MRKHSEGAWLETAVRFSEGLPEGSGRRAALLQRCEREGSDERLISRMISARAYALRWIDEEDIRASHKTVEILRTLDGINPAKAASVRFDVLTGVMGRPELTLTLNDEKIESLVRKTGQISMTLDEIIQQCRSDLDILNKFDWIEPPDNNKGEIFGCDAEYYVSDFDDTQNEVRYGQKWALVISPHISCSRIFGSGEKGFALSIAALSWSYPLVSVFCSSQHEKDKIAKFISMNMNEIFERKKVHFHVACKQ